MDVKPVDPSIVPQSPLAPPPPAAAKALPAAVAGVNESGQKTVLVTLPGDVVVEMAAPRQATQLAVGAMMGAEFSTYLLTVCKTLCHIRKIGGAPVAMPTSAVAAKVLMSQLSDAGMDLLINAYLENFQTTVQGGVHPAVAAALMDATREGIITAEQAKAIMGDQAAPISPLSERQ
jgi:hypothetical protein